MNSADLVAAIESGARDEFAARAQPQAGDAQRLATMRAAALAAIPVAAAPTPAVPQAAEGLLLKLGLGLLTTALVVGLGVATVRQVRRDTEPEAPPPSATETLRAPTRAAAPTHARAPTQAQAPAPVQAAAPAQNLAPSPPAQPVASPSNTGTSSPHSSSLAPAELLRLANEARRAGKQQRARQLYTRLISTHPTTREAGLAHVSLAKLSNPTEARAHYEAYLDQHPRGVLAEEASLGHARVLALLGAHEDERQAWQAFIRRFPKSPHAATAKQRLVTLAQ